MTKTAPQSHAASNLKTVTQAAPAYLHNGHSVSAERFYAIACDPQRSVAVQACAGAGKTWMLVSRMLRALLEADEPLQPQEILAITFTKKAAGEMRQRLNDWLAEFAQLPLPALEQQLRLRGFVEENGRMTLTDGALKLQKLYQTLLLAGRGVQIRTFHGWFAALLRTAPLSLLQALGLPSVYELLEDDAEAVEQAWPRFLQALTQDAEAQAEFNALVQTHGRFQSRRALEALLNRRVEFALADAHGVVATSVQPFGVQFPELAALALPGDALAPGAVYRADFDAAAVALGRASAPTFSAKGSELEQALTAGDADGALTALLTKTGEPRKFSEKVPDIARVRQAQELAQRLHEARAQHQAWLHQQRLMRLGRLLLDQFARLKRERGWIDMNDVERAAQAMLADEQLSGWLQQRLDARVRHLLIDEFQDTSPLQWQALLAWLSAYAGSGSGEAPKVFIVGDPKQSIYRFRRAEPQVFLAAQDFVRQGLGGELLSCDHTRRNAHAVIAGVNAAMLQAQQQGEYADFRAHTTDSSESGQMLFLPPIGLDDAVAEAEQHDGWRDSLSQPRELPEETRRTLECRQAARFVADVLQGRWQDGLPKPFQAGDVMVLARKRDRLAVMQDELRRLHIPALQPEKNLLGEAPEVADLVALMDALLSPSHDLSLAQALKSPLFGCGDEDLIALALARRPAVSDEAGKSWLELLPKVQSPSLDGAAVAVQLSRWQAWLNQLPPHDALQAIYDDGDVLARFGAAAPATARSRVIANLRALPAAALELDGGRYATPYALVRALRRGRIKAPVLAQPDAVQLLTVHGAKGLEARLVLLLDCDASPARADSMSVLVDWPGASAVPTRLSFLSSESHPPPCNAEALARELAERQREELNALYVAMTRARQSLVLSATMGRRADPGSWWSRLQPLAQALALPEPADAAAVSATPRADSHFFMKIMPDDGAGKGFSAINSEVEVPRDEATEQLANIGLAMHRLLEWLPLHAGTEALWSEAQRQAVARAFSLDAQALDQACTAAQAVRSGSAAWTWDPALIQWSGNEVALAYEGALLRLDRLVQRRDDGHWWVLDYKSTDNPLAQPALYAQLARYRDAVRAANPGATVRAAFLTPQGQTIELH